MHAKDHGRTKPGCDAPADHSQLHHVRGWKATYRTDINELTPACGPDDRLVEQGGFTNRKNASATPIGSRRQIWITANPEPIPSITPRNY
jgi:hypothetical protein